MLSPSMACFGPVRGRIAGAAAFAAAIAIGTACSTPPNGDPPAVTRKWLDAVVRVDSRSLTTTTCREEVRPGPRFTEALRAVLGTRMDVYGKLDASGLTVSLVESSQANAVVRIAGTLAMDLLEGYSEGEVDARIRLVLEDSGWKVCGTP